MAKPLYRMPNEIIYDKEMVVNGDFFPQAASDAVRSLDLGEEDVLITSYPKSGTTWMQELAYLLYNDIDVEKAKASHFIMRSKFLEVHIPGIGSGVDMIKDDPHPWVAKSHLPVRYFTKQLQEGKVKIIVVMRNPKDTLVSFYHFYQNNSVLGNFPGTWDEFFELIKAKHLQYADIFDWCVGWLSQRDNKNILYVKYEDMHQDLPGVIRQVARHCDKKIDEAAVEKIVNHVSFGFMRENPSLDMSNIPDAPYKVTNFFRKGQVGDWKNYFSKEQNKFIDDRYKKMYLPIGLKFDFE